tara:strand:- start:195 stop:560 length:366 start_codon:yes stop_codon:yes gene_type:complete
MSNPKDTRLYEKAKTKIYKQYDKPSAYRSGALVKEYKKLYQEKYGSTNAYEGSKKKEGLTRWFQEDWRNQRGEVGYKKKGDIYRPTKRVSKDTPKTIKELTPAEIKKGMKKKKEKGRVDKF